MQPLICFTHLSPGSQTLFIIILDKSVGHQISQLQLIRVFEEINIIFEELKPTKLVDAGC